jgi:hypothetical protein
LEINGSRRVDSASLRRTARAHGDGKSFAAEDVASPSVAAPLTGSGPIAAVDTILALQAIDDSTEGRSRGLAHGEQLLTLLDEVRDGLLAGGIPRAMLNRLASAVAKKREGFTDPKLQDVLDEIELRARVELAKLEYLDHLSA